MLTQLRSTRSKSAPSVKGQHARLSALVVEDTSHMASLICGILKSLGVGRIYVARNGEDALQMMADHEIDIAIIDDLAPPLNGLAVVKEIRTAQTSALSALPVIYVTAETRRSAIVAARDAGVTELLSKPFSASQLIARIDTVLTHPRPIIKSDDFVGPDRRRRVKDASEKKRKSDMTD